MADDTLFDDPSAHVLEGMRDATAVFVNSGSLCRTVICVVLLAGCPELEHCHGEKRSNPNLTSETRHSIPLSSAGGKEHRAVMLQHLETIQVIMNAFVEEDYELAKGLTELHLGFLYIGRQWPLSNRGISRLPIMTWLRHIMKRLRSWRALFRQKTSSRSCTL